MPDSVIIHAGLPKTGTTPLQSSLSELSDPRIYFYKTPEVNNSHQIERGFFGNHAFLSQSSAIASQRDLLRQLTRCESDIFVISGEVLTNYAGFPEEGLVLLKQIVEVAANDFSVMVYLRNIHDFSASIFQEYIKHGYSDHEIHLRLGIRKRIEPLIKVYGPNKIMFRRFGKGFLEGDNIVKDFFFANGVSSNDVGTCRANEGLSLPILSVLYKLNTENNYPGLENLHEFLYHAHTFLLMKSLEIQS